MFAPPTDLNTEHVTRALFTHWGIEATSVTYEPVGFGTHHYAAIDAHGTRWFVNVDDLPTKTWFATGADSAFRWLDAAFSVVATLPGLGLDFVVAPIATGKGEVLVRLSDRYAAAVVPFVDGTSPPFGEYENDSERREVLTMLGRLHAATDRVGTERLAQNDLSVPMRGAFFATLDELDVPWETGPYAEPVREVLTSRRDRIVDAFANYDEIASRVDRSGWVVTHGEPHAANVMRRHDGTLVLIDWDTFMVAPKERDLWQVGPTADDGWRPYVDAGGRVEPEQPALELFRLWWDLAEVTGYTESFRSPHVDDANTQAMWKWFNHFLP